MTSWQQNEDTSDDKGEQVWGAPSCCLSTARTGFIDTTGTKHVHKQHHTVNCNTGVSPVTKQTPTLWRRAHPLEKWVRIRPVLFLINRMFSILPQPLRYVFHDTISQPDAMSKRSTVRHIFFGLFIYWENGGTIQYRYFFVFFGTKKGHNAGDRSHERRANSDRQ